MSTADPKVGLVLAGGGARGAYEAGALSVLLPALEARGERPGVLLGTSVGAVNTAWLAATAHLDAAGSTESMLDRWRTLGWDAVLGPLVSPFELSRALVYLGELLGVPGAALTNLLDTGPQAATLREQIDFDQLRRNIESGDLQTAAVVATSYATGDSVVFYDRHGGAAAITDDRRRGIRYANSSLAPDHVQASAAIEALFPAIDITAPAKFAGWYGDGGAQLNTPIKPALTLGSGRVVVVGLNSLQPPPTPVRRRPEVFDGLALILQSMLADQLAHDVQTLATINICLGWSPPPSAPAGGASAPASGQSSAGPYRPIPYIFVAPADRHSVGRVAVEVWKRYSSRLRGRLRERDVALLGKLIDAGLDPIRGELLSYLFFSPEFHTALIGLGRADAQAWLDGPHDDGIWQCAPCIPGGPRAFG